MHPGKRKAEHNPLSANVEDQHACSHGKTGSPKDPLLAIKGVGQKTADKLRKAGYSSVKQLRKATPTELSQSTGIASVTASNIIRAAKTRRPALLRMLANLMRDPFPRVQRCRDCTWWSRAGLDGHINKGICNYGTDQTKPFTMTVGQRVNIAWARQRGCDHFKRISLDIRH